MMWLNSYEVPYRMEVEKGHSEDAGDDEPYISQTSKQAGLHGLKRFFRQMRGHFRRVPAERVKIIHSVISFQTTLRLTSSGEAIHTLLVATKTLFHKVIPKAVIYAEMMRRAEKSSRSL